METQSDVSYGVIPVRREAGEWRVLLIHQYSRHTRDAYWVFPKGHAEPGESPAAAARRELFEETGLTPERLETEYPYSIEYTFSHDGVRIEKRVDFFIGIIEHPEYALQADEVREAGWFTVPEARERLTHEQPKAVLEAVASDLAARN
jgi:8-oxo-dGTP pyrophosphatase MutT (NUDIX family)